MWFGEILSEKFFSLLASKNKELYLSALLLIQKHYQQELLLKKSGVMALLIDHLEDQIWQMEGENQEDPGSSLSARAYYLLRQLLAAGWLEREYHYQSLEEFLLLPEEAAVILEAVQNLQQSRQYNSLVYSTYSSLSTADRERDDYMLEALQQAYRSTQELQENLRRLFNNMRRHYQNLYKKKAVQDLIQEHFENYQALILDKVYHPLKTLDSIPRYKSRIINILRDWLIEPPVLEHLVELSLQKGFYTASAREEALNWIVQQVSQIMDIYQHLELTLREIDRKNASYTKVLVERVRYLLNQEQSLAGQLVEILKHSAGWEANLAEEIQLYRQYNLNENSLARAKEKKPVFAQPEALSSATDEAELQRELDLFEQRISQTLTKEKIIAFIQDKLQGRAFVHIREFVLADDLEFVKLILAAVKAAELPFKVEFRENYFSSNGYRVPEMIFWAEEVNKTGA